MKIKFTFLFLASLFVFSVYSQTRYLKGSLQGGQEVPPNSSSGLGTVIVKYDTVTNQLQLWGDYQNLTSSISAAHIHQAPVGVSGPIIVPLTITGDSTGTISGTGVLTDAQEIELLAGNMYVNVHSDSFPAGELRAQLTTATDNQAELFSGNLQGAQEVPPDSSSATGAVTVLLDKGTDSVFLTGNFKGLTSDVVAAHIHRGRAGVSGPVIVPLFFSGDISGTITGTGLLSASDVSAMDSGHTYVNVHTTLFPAGEIRAQLFIKQQLLFFKGTLQGSQEVPPNSSSAHGIVILKYDTATNVLELWGDYQNLSAGITAAHIHQAPPGVSGSVIVPLNFAGDSTGSLTGSGTFTDAQEVDLIAGNMYVNVHSTTYPAGEIRAQLSVATPGQSDLLSGNLEEAQEVPPTGSTAIGSVKALLDKGTDSVFVTGNYFGLSDTPTAAHIHRAPVGVAGPVIVPLNARGSDTGAVSGAGLLVASDVMEMVNGNTYVNVHSSLFPAGEIRGQLGDIVLPVKLLYFNGYKDQNRVTLLWASAQEINFSHYEIEQQNPVSKQWVKKATIAGTNNESGSQYRYSDLPATYKNDYVFYRLKMVDKDGRFSYSPVIRINYNQVKAELLIRPNPVRNGELQFTITGLSTDRKIYFVIADYNGREGISGLASSLSNNTINVSSLAPGMYKLIVKFDNIILQQSFIK